MTKPTIETLQWIKGEIDGLKGSLQAIEEAFTDVQCRLKQKPAEPKPCPQEGDEYWSVCDDGKVLNFTWLNDSVDRARLARGNCFRTQEQAELSDKQDLVMQKLRDIYGASVGAINSHPFLLRYIGNEWVVTENGDLFAGAIGFEDQESGYGAIDDLGDELNVLLKNPWEGNCDT